jgi:hypothetical protein
MQSSGRKGRFTRREVDASHSVQRRLRLAWTLALSTSLMAACATPASYYRVKRSTTFSAEAESVQPLPINPAVRAQLAPPKTIAVVPPDSCDDRNFAGTGRSEDALRMQCGSMVGTLEAQAAAAGWTVVTWQVLKGPRGRAIDYAAQYGVDYVFEVNQLGTIEMGSSVRQETDIQFDVVDRVGTPLEPASLPAEVADRCAALFAPASIAAPPIESVAADIRVVDVMTGQVLYAYRSSAVALVENQSEESRYWLRREEASNLGGPIMLVTGLVASAVSLAYALSEEEAELLAGTVGLGVSLPIAVSGLSRTLSGGRIPPPDHVCAVDSIGLPGTSTVAVSRQRSSASSVSVVTTDRARNTDAANAERRAIEAEVSRFIAQLRGR